MDDYGDTVRIAGCERAGYWCKNTVLYCYVLYLGVMLGCRNEGAI